MYLLFLQGMKSDFLKCTRPRLNDKFIKKLIFNHVNIFSKRNCLLDEE